MTWSRILASGTTTHEHRVGHVLCRFYRHENGHWCVRVHSVGGMTILTYPTKREAWEKGRRAAEAAREHDVAMGLVRVPPQPEPLPVATSPASGYGHYGPYRQARRVGDDH